MCREPINPGARKCLKCDSYQGWQRYLGFSSSILALLIALISVSQSAAPVFVRLYEGDRSEVALHLLKTDGQALKLIATNGGNRPGTLDDGVIALDEDYSFPLQGSAAVGVIEPGAMKEVTLTLEPGYDSQLIQLAEERSPPLPPVKDGVMRLVSHRPMPATARLSVIQFDGSTSTHSFPVQIHCGGSACHLRQPVRKRR